MSKHDGGPAFPTKAAGYLGMSLRDYFAGQALLGLVGNMPLGNDPEDFAKRCFEFADAMLEARK